MYNNPYMTAYNPQQAVDRINAQITELENMKKSIPQTQAPITQNFQIAPTNTTAIRYASSIDDVQKEIVIGDTPYFSKDLSILWIKNTKGEVKTYELTEIIPKDEKDLQIELLTEQINELKGMISNEQLNADDDGKYDEESTTEDDDTTRTATKKSKPTSISRVSKSKTK